MKEAIEKKRLNNIILKDVIPYDEVVTYLKNADLGLTLLKKNKYLDAAYPVKAFDYMAAAMPILVSGGLAMKKLIEENEIGFWVNAEKPEELASKILEISKMDKNNFQEIGKRGRKLVEERFNRAEQAKKLEKILEDVVQSENRS